MDVVGDDATSIKGHVKVLQDQYRKAQPETRIDEERMRRTFGWRWKDITGGITVEDAVNKYLFLKSPSGFMKKLVSCINLLISAEESLIEDHPGMQHFSRCQPCSERSLNTLLCLGSKPSSSYPTVQVQEATDWKNVLTRKLTVVLKSRWHRDLLG